MACYKGPQSSCCEQPMQFCCPPRGPNGIFTATCPMPCDTACPAPACVPSVPPQPSRKYMSVPHPMPPKCPLTCCIKCPSSCCPPPFSPPSFPLYNKVPCCISKFCPYPPWPSTKPCTPLPVCVPVTKPCPLLIKPHIPRILRCVPNICCTACRSSHQNTTCTPCLPCGAVGPYIRQGASRTCNE